MAAWFKKNGGGKKMMRVEWFIFNLGTDQEFAECAECGHEQVKGPEGYPMVCPGCGCEVALKVADSVEV